MAGPRFVETTRKKPPAQAVGERRAPVLVIAHHATLARAGDVLALGDRVELSRLGPAFAPSATGTTSSRDAGSPLDDPFVSRTPIVIRRDGTTVVVENPNGVEVTIGGGAVAVSRTVTTDELARGIDIVLGGRVVLWLTTDHAGASDELGMFGASGAMHALRTDIRAAADHANHRDAMQAEAGGAPVATAHRATTQPAQAEAAPVATAQRAVTQPSQARGVPVATAHRAAMQRSPSGSCGPILVEGETGAGKELVARALHAVARPDGPFVAVNVAAIPAAVAAAEVFGHEKGAFTGATERRAGYFERAQGGVLFLDEIGDLPESVQPVLLRALESGEVQPVGGQPKRVDALVVAATDADLERAAATGRYRGPLYYRLATTTLRVPPLRERRVDIGPLLARFLRDALDGPLADQATIATPWLPAALVADLMRAPWPGNIRQLRAIAGRLATIARTDRTASLDALGLDLDDASEETANLTMRTYPAGTGSSPSSQEHDSAPDPKRKITESTLIATLRANQFHLARTAEALEISRTHLDALIAASGTLRKAKDLGADEIAACVAELGDDVDAIAARLEVSPRGLRLRIRQLGL